MSTRSILLTGATGYVGGRLLGPLLDAGHDVRCLVRNPDRADLDPRAEVVQGDLVSGEGLDDALDGIEVAYYLVHSMGGDGDFAARDRDAATAFAGAATGAGVARVVYLGGLDHPDPDEDGGPSEHLRSREEVAKILAGGGYDFVHARAAMVIGAGGASYVILKDLVHHLPVMVTPRWVDTRSQPVAIDDVVGAFVALAVRDTVPEEVELGGADVLTYREMMGRYAVAAGRRNPAILPVPALTPRLSSYWVSLFTSVDMGLIRPLVDGLSVEMTVQNPPPPGINDAPLGFDEAVRRALHELP
jgi:uncharacterized protein YbjT (DUF2867 family)